MRGKRHRALPWAANKSGKKRMHIKKGDRVVVISGAFKGDEAHEVLSVDAVRGTVVIQGVNLRWKHERKSKKSPQGGRTRSERPIDVSKVLLYSEKAKKGVRTRTEVVDEDGKRKRVRVGTCGTKFDS